MGGEPPNNKGSTWEQEWDIFDFYREELEEKYVEFSILV